MPLNAPLYNSITAALSRGGPAGLPGGKVIVKGNGTLNNIRRIPDSLNPGHTKSKVVAEGETYWVCCPFCGDTKFRLCINHAWQTKDPENDTHFLIHCFNEECQEEEGFFREMEYRLNRFNGGKVSQSSLNHVASQVAQRREVTSPGPCVPLHELPPTHHTHTLLRNRGHDPFKLSHNFGLSYCIHSTMPMADQRIIIPAAMNAKLVGWQARYVDDFGGGDVTGLFTCPQCREKFRAQPRLRPVLRAAKPVKRLPSIGRHLVSGSARLCSTTTAPRTSTTSS